MKNITPFILALLMAATLILPGCAANLPSKASLPAAGLPRVDTAAAQRLLTPDESLQTLDFPTSGTKTLSGRVQGYQTVVYALPIRQGQRLEVTMDTPSDSAYFNIVDAKDTSGAALFAGEATNTRTALIRATEDATYLLRPYLNRAVARRGSSADYTFKIERQ
jgi:hypothetical protein